VYFWPYPVFEAVGYDEIQRDTADMQLDIARHARIYSWIQRDTAGYGGSSCTMARYRDTAGYQGYGEIQRQDAGEIQAGIPKNTRQGRAELSKAIGGASRPCSAHCRAHLTVGTYTGPGYIYIYIYTKKQEQLAREDAQRGKDVYGVDRVLRKG